MSLSDRLRAQGIVSATLRSRAKKYEPGKSARVDGSADMRRIVRIPQTLPLSDQERESLSREFIKASALRDGKFKLWDQQLQAIRDYREHGGLFGPIGVGGGKTITSFVCSHVAYTERGHERIALMVPPKLVSKTMHDLVTVRNKVVFDVPVTNLHGQGKRARWGLTSEHRHGLFIFPYSLLSVEDGADLLQRLGATCYVMDEAHKLKNLDAASTKRWLHCVDSLHEQGKKMEFVALSGTMTTKGIFDYYHHIVRALKDGAPVPLVASEARDWDAAIGAQAETDARCGSLSTLIQWAKDHFPKEKEELPETRAGFRRAYNLRLESTPGVVVAGDVDVRTSLNIDLVKCEIPDTEDGRKLHEHVKTLDECLITPTGEDLPHVLLAWKWKYELSGGFYNKKVWPEPESLAMARSISIAEANDLLARARRYHDKREVYNKRLKIWIEEFGEPGLDTPMTIGNWMLRHGHVKVGKELYSLWMKVREADFEGRPERISIPVRVCDFRAEAAAEWAQKLNAGCILWCHNKAMRVWIVEKLRKRTKRKVINGAAADPDVPREILDPKNSDAIFVLSAPAYREGHNLQFLQHQLFVQVPRGADTAEQCMGRIHRPGQEADEVTAHFLMATETDDMAFAACAVDSLYIDQTVTPQKLMTGSYLCPPPHIDLDVLRRQVPDVHKLSAEQRLLYAEKFLS